MNTPITFQSSCDASFIDLCKKDKFDNVVYPLFIFSCQEVESDNVLFPLLNFIQQEVDAYMWCIHNSLLFVKMKNTL